MLGKIIDLFSGRISDKNQEQEPPSETEDATPQAVFDFVALNEIRPFDHKFPLQKDDILIIRGGRNYKVCVQKMTGAITNITATLKWLNKPDANEKDQVEQIKFKSLRELNYYVQREKNYIEDIVKVNWYTKEETLSMDECHELALRINRDKQRIRRYMETRMKQGSR